MNKITFGASKRFENSFITQSILPTLHYKSKSVVNTFMGLLLQKPHKRRIIIFQKEKITESINIYMNKEEKKKKKKIGEKS